MNEKQIAKVLVQKLLDMGFTVHRYNAVTTNSIYLKLDYGVCCGIRIADHNGKKKYHYTFEELPQLLNMVQKERESKIKKYGLENYKLYMEKEKQENELFNRFKMVA